jgi:hypothetical protein
LRRFVGSRNRPLAALATGGHRSFPEPRAFPVLAAPGDQQGLYVALSRGREANYAYCVTGFPRAADIREGSQPAAELERVRVLMAERAGLTPPSAVGEAEDRGGTTPCCHTDKATR